MIAVNCKHKIQHCHIRDILLSEMVMALLETVEDVWYGLLVGEGYHRWWGWGCVGGWGWGWEYVGCIMGGVTPLGSMSACRGWSSGWVEPGEERHADNSDTK